MTVHALSISASLQLTHYFPQQLLLTLKLSSCFDKRKKYYISCALFPRFLPEGRRQCKRKNWVCKMKAKILEQPKEKRNLLDKDDAIRNAKNFDEILDIQYGKIGNKTRDEFETKAQYFVISETLKSARREANLTQEQLATKVGTKKSYISRLENGKCDIQLSTLYKIFEDGLGKRISLLIG